VSVCGCESESVRVLGSGSSFVGPLFSTWAEVYTENTVSAPLIRYISSSSQLGLADLKDNTTVFSITEDPDMIHYENATTPFVGFPVSVGAVAIIYNFNANRTHLASRQNAPFMFSNAFQSHLSIHFCSEREPRIDA
jgi:ABC-type phosphate transport system substrate-binding protein